MEAAVVERDCGGKNKGATMIHSIFALVLGSLKLRSNLAAFNSLLNEPEIDHLRVCLEVVVVVVVDSVEVAVDLGEETCHRWG